MKPRWISNSLTPPVPSVCLCLSDKEFRRVMRDCDIALPGNWVESSNGARAHILKHDTTGRLCVVVCLKTTGASEEQIAALLVHEAVHIWQYWCEKIGEDKPGEEQEAYAIQSLSQTLFTEYARRKK